MKDWSDMERSSKFNFCDERRTQLLTYLMFIIGLI